MSTFLRRYDTVLKKYCGDGQATICSPLTWKEGVNYIFIVVVVLLTDLNGWGFINTAFLMAPFMFLFILRLICHRNRIIHHLEHGGYLPATLIVFIAGGVAWYFVPHPALLMTQIILPPLIFFLISLRYATLSRAGLVLFWSVPTFLAVAMPLWVGDSPGNRAGEISANLLSVIIPFFLSKIRYVPFKIITWKTVVLPVALMLVALLFLFLADEYRQLQGICHEAATVCFLCGNFSFGLLMLVGIFILPQNRWGKAAVQCRN